jgi:hypothetical protein
MFGRFELTVSKLLVVPPGFPRAGVASNSGTVFSSWAKLAKHRLCGRLDEPAASAIPHRLSRQADHLATRGCVTLSVLRQTMSEIHDHD